MSMLYVRARLRSRHGLVLCQTQVCKNPRNPGFNHYLFESVAALIRHAGSSAGMIETFEQLLFPAFNHVLQQVRRQAGNCRCSWCVMTGSPAVC